MEYGYSYKTLYTVEIVVVVLDAMMQKSQFYMTFLQKVSQRSPMKQPSVSSIELLHLFHY